jgi:hypothetical protein
MPPPKPRVPLPMHSLGPRWELIEQARAASKLLTDSLHLNAMTVARRRLSRCIGEPIAMPTAPRATTGRVQLFHCAPAFAKKVRTLATEAPWHLNRAEDLIGELDAATFPMGRPNADSMCFAAPVGRADIAGASERGNLDNSGLFYHPTPIARLPLIERWPTETTPRHSSITLLLARNIKLSIYEGFQLIGAQVLQPVKLARRATF